MALKLKDYNMTCIALFGLDLGLMGGLRDSQSLVGWSGFCYFPKVGSLRLFASVSAWPLFP